MRKIVEQKPFPTNSTLGVLRERLRTEAAITLGGLNGSSRSLLASLLFASQTRSLVAVLPTEKEARDFSRDCLVFSGEPDVLHFPAWNMLTADFFAVQKEIELARLRTLSCLLSGRPYLIITSLTALTQKIIPRHVFTDYTRTLSLGDILDRDDLVQRLIRGGYTKKTLVEGKGEFSARGHILDIYPPDAANPFRVELMGDEVESIRQFDPASQRSTVEILEFQIVPVRELVLTEQRRQRAIRSIRARANDLELPRQIKDQLTEAIDNDLLSSLNPMYLSLFFGVGDDPSDSGQPEKDLGTFFDYCSGRELFFFDDAASLARSFEELENTINRFLLQARRENKFFVEAESFHLSSEEFNERTAPFQQIRHEALHFHTPPLPGAESVAPLPLLFQTEKMGLFKSEGPAAAEGLLFPLVEKIQQSLGSGDLVFFMCPGPEDIPRMAHLLEGYGLKTNRKDPDLSFLDQVMHHQPPGRLFLLEGKVTTGFRFPDLNLTVMSEEEVFGRKQVKRYARPAREGYFLKSFGELTEGDFIVHKDHGIGVYRGLQKMSVAEIENDFLLIEYAEHDRLYIPIDRLDQIQRYIGPEGYAPKTDRLGGTSWETVKERVKKSIRDIAEELVSIYAAREVIEREVFSPPDRLYEEFCAAFEYEETPDQVRAIEDIHEDMAHEKPMDRLICGDAGFGKTEVALRASFRAAMDGRQVAVLVPTTILAEQHYQTFSAGCRITPYELKS